MQCEAHTSRDCNAHAYIYICLLVCLDLPLIFQMKEFKLFIKIESPHALESESEGLLPDCSIDMKEKMTQVEAWMATYFCVR